MAKIDQKLKILSKNDLCNTDFEKERDARRAAFRTLHFPNLYFRDV